MKNIKDQFQAEAYFEGYKAGVAFTTETAERALNAALPLGDTTDTSALSYTGALKFALSILDSLKWKK